jgi:hypothetical protein
VRLNVDSVSYWMATNNAPDNLKKRDYFARYGIIEGIRQLAIDFPFQPHRSSKAAPALQPATSLKRLSKVEAADDPSDGADDE